MPSDFNTLVFKSPATKSSPHANDCMNKERVQNKTFTKLHLSKVPLIRHCILPNSFVTALLQATAMLATTADAVAAGMAEPEMARSDLTASDNSDQSMHEGHLPSPDHPTSQNTITAEQPSSQPRPGTSSGRRRKVPHSVTPNACTNCKKARAKVSPCLPMVYVFLYERKWHAKLSTIVRRSQASLPTLREPSRSRLLSLRDPCEDSKTADAS